MERTVWLVLCLGTLVSGLWGEAGPPVPPHPRLLVGASDFEGWKDRLAADPTLKAWHDQLKREGDALVNHPVYRYELRDGVRLLMVSRDVLKLVTTEALLYRIDGDPRYLARAWAELDNVARFPDWHPKHFLDVAEMAAAVAIGSDWLWDSLTSDQRTELREALVHKALEPAAPYLERHEGWATVTNNWNFVCCGGITMAALAIAGEDRSWIDRLLPRVLEALPHALAGYAPDGAWNESPGYWDYGTTYLVELITSLERSLGSDYGLWKSPGLDRTGLFAAALSGPGSYKFGYGDVGGSGGWVSSPALWMLGRHFGQPVDGWARRAAVGGRPLALDLLWYDSSQVSATPEQTGLPLDQEFRRVEVATFRSSWSDPQALFVGVKGTAFPDRNHTDLDSGSVFVGALGEVWFTDLGSDDYNLPGYFTMDPRKAEQRWNYYRKRAEGHNTLVINPGRGPDQDPSAQAPLVGFPAGGREAGAAVDLTRVYPGARKVVREVRMADGQNSLTIHDQVILGSPGEVWAFFHLAKGVDAQLSPDGRSATLTRPRKPGSLSVTITGGPPGWTFLLVDAVPLPGSPAVRQDPNSGCRKLALHAAGFTEGDWTVRVEVR